MRTGCAPGELTTSAGTCVPAGIERCAYGFESDGARSCRAIAPNAACPAGKMAVPGERACREVMPCGAGRWGDVARPAGTQHVDATYAGGDSDGTEDKPWTTIGAGVAAAAPGATVAVAGGTYVEWVDLRKPVVVSGRCPALVDVRGSNAGVPAFVIRAGADGAIVRGVSAYSAGGGVLVSAALDVVLDRVRIHEVDSFTGLTVANSWGPATVTLRDSLVEDTSGLTGVSVLGAKIVIERSVVRGSKAGFTNGPGRGVDVTSLGTTRGRAEIRGSILEGNSEFGVSTQDSDLVLEASLVRGTVPVKGTGFGVGAQSSGAAAATANIVGSVIEKSFGMGVVVSGAKLDMSDTVIRGTLEGVPPAAGRGLQLQQSVEGSLPAEATVRSSVVEQNREVGVVVVSSRATLEGVIVRDTASRADGVGGLGVDAQFDPVRNSAPSTMTMRGSRVERSVAHGVVAWGASVTLESVLVSDTRVMVAGGSLGDGVVVASGDGVVSTLTLSRSRIERSERAGLANLSSEVKLVDSDITCNGLDVDAEVMDGVQAYRFEVEGSNACGCAPLAACGFRSANIEPPSIRP